jgi:hypothetical protein
METIIVFIDDANYAKQLLQPMLSAASQEPMRWVLVGCAPRITRHISKWVTQSARINWQTNWADKVFAQVVPMLQTPDRLQDSVTTQLASSKLNLCELTQSLRQQHGQGRVLDARRPKLGHEMQPVTAGQQQESSRMTGYATALVGAGMLAGLD